VRQLFVLRKKKCSEIFFFFGYLYIFRIFFGIYFFFGYPKFFFFSDIFCLGKILKKMAHSGSRGVTYFSYFDSGLRSPEFFINCFMRWFPCSPSFSVSYMHINFSCSERYMFADCSQSEGAASCQGTGGFKMEHFLVHWFAGQRGQSDGRPW
jgi:hypothetical protein